MKRSTSKMIHRPGAVWRFMTDRKAPALPKLAVLFAVAYVIWPLDLIPDVAPIISWLDDLGVVTLAAGWLSRSVLKYEAVTSAPAELALPEESTPSGI